MKLKSIKAEAAACRKAFKGFRVGGFVIHCHHDRVLETLREPAEARIEYILKYKPLRVQALRLRLFRPVSKRKWSAASRWSSRTFHAMVCANDCPWNGHTIFSGKECLP